MFELFPKTRMILVAQIIAQIITQRYDSVRVGRICSTELSRLSFCYETIKIDEFNQG